MGTRSLAIVLFVLGCLPAFAQQETPSSTPATPSVETTTSLPKKDAPLDLSPDAEGKLSQQQMQELLRVVAEKDLENDKRQRDYTYIEREVQTNLDGKGQAKSKEIKTYEVLEIDGEQV